MASTNELAVYTASITLDAKSFKNKSLYQSALVINAAREEAASVVLGAFDNAKAAKDKFEREAGKVLAAVQDGKMYEADGYKSAADFAASVFGLNKSDCSSYIRAHKMRVAYPELADMPRTNIDRLSSADREAVKKAIADESLTADATQEQVKSFVSEHPAKAKPAKVLPTYDIYAPNDDCPSEFSTLIAEKVLEDDFPEVLTDASGGKPDYIVKLKGKDIPGTFIIPVRFSNPMTTLLSVRVHISEPNKRKAAEAAAKLARAEAMTALMDDMKAGKLTYDEFLERMNAIE